MNLSQQPGRIAVGSPAHAAWERRRRAAWIDYLRTTREAASGHYQHVEDNAWEQLQRRLRRNDELLAEATR
jgi:hypothetical protein